MTIIRFGRRVAMWTVLYYIRFWAKAAVAVHRPVIVGIAGSVGKSSTKEAVVAMLTEVARPTFTYGNSETGVPLGILGITAGSSSAMDWLRIMIQCPLSIGHLRGYSHLIVEMGTDEPVPPKNMEYLLTIVKPDIAVLLNTFAIHTQQFASVLTKLAPAEVAGWDESRQAEYATKALAEEDAKIITANPHAVAIYNGDNALVAEQMLADLTAHPWRTTKVFGLAPDSDIQYGTYHISPSGSSFAFRQKDEDFVVEVGHYLLPEVYREVIAAALLVGQQLGFERQALVNSFIQHFHLPKGRASVFKGIKQSAIIDSSYNASAPAMLAFIAMVAELKQQTGRPAVLLLGDMRELGPAAAEEHAKVAQAAAEVADMVYLVGPLTKAYIQPLLEQLKPGLAVTWFEHSTAAGQSLAQVLPDQALVLAKGSQNTIFVEEAVKQLLAEASDASRLCRQEGYWLQRKSS